MFLWLLVPVAAVAYVMYLLTKWAVIASVIVLLLALRFVVWAAAVTLHVGRSYFGPTTLPPDSGSSV